MPSSAPVTAHHVEAASGSRRQHHDRQRSAAGPHRRPLRVESRAHALEMGQALVEMTGKLGIGFIYKTSFDKANRTSIEQRARHRPREGLAILAEMRETTGCRC